jgi:hypothetical protein
MRCCHPSDRLPRPLHRQPPSSLRFADDLLALLDIEPGAVTPFGVLNDQEAQRVVSVLDKRLLHGAHDTVYGHPLHNEVRCECAVSAQ